MISKNLSRVLLAPIVSEKAVQRMDAAFWVTETATKAEIKKAVEELFEVSVKKVTTVTARKRIGGRFAKRGNTNRTYVKRKKAYIQLAPNSEFNLALD